MVAIIAIYFSLWKKESSSLLSSYCSSSGLLSSYFSSSGLRLGVLGDKMQEAALARNEQFRVSKVDENEENNCKLVQGEQSWFWMKEILALDILWTPKVWMWEEKKCLQRHICIGHFLKAGAAPKQSTSHRNQGPGGKILKVRNIHRSSFHNFVISLFRYFTISLFHYFVISIFSYFIFSNGQRWNRGEWNVLFCKTTATRRGSFPSRK